MFDENVKAQMRKGSLEYCILLILSEGDAYVSDITARLKVAQMIVVEGTLYPLLMRQKNAGLLTYRWEESTQGPPRKYYSLTKQGREMLQCMDTIWCDLVSSVSKLRRKIRKNNHGYEQNY